MPQNFFITGNPKAGKTTLIKRLAAELRKSGLKVGGIISPVERHHGSRTAFYSMNIETGKKSELASITGDGPKVSKYHVNVKSFESISLPIMGRFENYDVIVIDEIGRMEMTSRKFANLLEDLLDSDVPFIATLQKDYESKYLPLGKEFRLNPNEHDAVFFRILREAKKNFTKRAPRKAKVIAKKAMKKAPPKKKARKKEAKKEMKKETVKKKPEKESRGILGKIRDLLGF